MINKENKRTTAAAPLALLAFVMVVAAMTLVSQIPEFVTSLYIQVRHPAEYRFPAYDRLLKKIVKGDLVDYHAMIESKEFKEAVDDLARTSPDGLLDDKKRLCYWINAYNLLVLKAVSAGYPADAVKSTRLLRTLGSTKHMVAGRWFYLEQIKEFQLMPRLSLCPLSIFLVCGGSRGYPPLQDHAIQVESIEKDSVQAVRHFVLNPENVSSDPEKKTMTLSPFFKWNERYLTGFPSPHEFVNSFLPEDKQIDFGWYNYQLYTLPFNWVLNDSAVKIIHKDDAVKKTAP